MATLAFKNVVVSVGIAKRLLKSIDERLEKVPFGSEDHIKLVENKIFYLKIVFDSLTQ